MDVDEFNHLGEPEAFFVIDGKGRWGITYRGYTVIPYRYGMYIGIGWSVCRLLWLRGEQFHSYESGTWRNSNLWKEALPCLLSTDRDYSYVEDLPTFVKQRGQNPKEELFQKKIMNMQAPSLEKDLVIEFLKEQGYLDGTSKSN